MKDGKRTFLIGDLHFGHANIIRYCNRPFKDIDEMEKILIKNWNGVVGKDDTVIVVGDFALLPVEKMASITKQLNGHKHLVLGNHDTKAIKTYLDMGFEVVSPYSIILDEYFIVSHKPQFIENQGLFANIYAHVHDLAEYKDYTARSFCVSAERINYTPIDFDEIKAKMESVDFGQ